MKTKTIIVALISILGFIGCSKENSSSDAKQVAASKQLRLVPATVSELEVSPDFKLDYTTKGGIKFYIRRLSPQVADSIGEASPDHEFLGGGSQQYLLAAVHNGKVVSLETLDALMKKPDGGLTEAETKEVFAYVFKQMAKDSAADLKQ